MSEVLDPIISLALLALVWLSLWLELQR